MRTFMCLIFTWHAVECRHISKCWHAWSVLVPLHPKPFLPGACSGGFAGAPPCAEPLERLLLKKLPGSSPVSAQSSALLAGLPRSVLDSAQMRPWKPSPYSPTRKCATAHDMACLQSALMSWPCGAPGTSSAAVRPKTAANMFYYLFL